MTRLYETIVSTCIMAAINSAQFPLFFNYVAELFPTRMRGVANAVILFLAKMIGSFAPFVSTYSKNKGYHILVGCSAVVLISLPLSFFVKETFEGAGTGDDSDDSNGESSYETMARSKGSMLSNGLKFGKKSEEGDDEM